MQDGVVQRLVCGIRRRLRSSGCHDYAPNRFSWIHHPFPMACGAPASSQHINKHHIVLSPQLVPQRVVLQLRSLPYDEMLCFQAQQPTRSEGARPQRPRSIDLSSQKEDTIRLLERGVGLCSSSEMGTRYPLCTRGAMVALCRQEAHNVSGNGEG